MLYKNVLILSVCVCPYVDLLEKYDELRQSASDDALRQFLLLFKEHHTQVRGLIILLSTNFDFTL